MGGLGFGLGCVGVRLGWRGKLEGGAGTRSGGQNAGPSLEGFLLAVLLVMAK